MSESKPTRRAMLAAGASLLAGPALAQTGAWPSRPIRLVVAYPPGNSSDLVARFVGERMMGLLGQPVVVENRSGAGGTVGTEYYARSQPDGYTLGISNAGPLTIAPSLYPNLGYDPVRDFTQIAPLAIGAHIFVVHPSLPVRNIQELIAYAKARPGQVFYGSSGNGSTSHLAMALFANLTGVELSHVPYRGSSAAISDLLAGRFMLMSDTVVATKDLVRDGRLRALGVTSREITPFVPEITPIAAQGVPDYDFYGWIGIAGPAGIPAPVVQKLYAAATAVTAQHDFEARMADFGLSRMTHTLPQLDAFIRDDVARWRDVIPKAGIRLDQ
jgi:tripartite-type tricarboxylate transporter receptor subunit TctC